MEKLPLELCCLIAEYVGDHRSQLEFANIAEIPLCRYCPSERRIAPAISFSVSPNQQRFARCTEHNDLYIHETKSKSSGRAIHFETKIDAVHFLDDNRILLLPYGNSCFRVWNIEEKRIEIVHNYNVGFGTMYCIWDNENTLRHGYRYQICGTFQSPNGAIRLQLERYYGETRIWRRGSPEWDYRTFATRISFRERITSVAFASTRPVFAIGTLIGAIHIYYYDDERVKRVRRLQRDGAILRVAFSPDDLMIAANIWTDDDQGKLVVWNHDSFEGRAISKIAFDSPIQFISSGTVAALNNGSMIVYSLYQEKF